MLYTDMVFFLIFLYTPNDAYGDVGDVSVIEEKQHDDFSFLSCSEKRNITIFMAFYSELPIRDIILEQLHQLAANEDCFTFNFYLNNEDRVIRLKKDTFLNVMEWNNDRYFN